MVADGTAPFPVPAMAKQGAGHAGPVDGRGDGLAPVPNLDLVQSDDVRQIEGLSVEFRTDHGWVRVLQDVNLGVAPGQIVGLVGESGSGKTVASLATMGLLLKHSARVSGSPVGS